MSMLLAPLLALDLDRGRRKNDRPRTGSSASTRGIRTGLRCDGPYKAKDFFPVYLFTLTAVACSLCSRHREASPNSS